MESQPSENPVEVTSMHEGPQENTPEASPEMLKNKIRNRLLKLDALDDETDATQEKIKEALGFLRDSIRELIREYPDDPDVGLFEMIYEDLREDFEAGENVELDESYESILTAMQEAISESGIRKEESLDEIKDPALSEVITQIEGIGVSPEYVVVSPEENAKTIVLFLQAHPNPGMSSELRAAAGVDESQDEIETAITELAENEVSQTIFVEGIPSGRDGYKLLKSIGPGAEEFGFVRAADRNKEIQLIGYEDMPLLRATARGLYGISENDLGDQAAIRYRMSAANALIASNIAMLTKDTEDISLMVLGGGHESHPAVENISELPISEAIAYYGLNVIVVDSASKYFDEEAYEAYTEVAEVFEQEEPEAS